VLRERRRGEGSSAPRPSRVLHRAGSERSLAWTLGSVPRRLIGEHGHVAISFRPVDLLLSRVGE